MLSDWEVKDIERTLATNPPKDVDKRLRNQLSEHGYSLKYPPFQPLSHHRQFINHKTDEQTLHQIIELARNATSILLDTESTPIYRQPNRPSLIQLQLNSTDPTPTVIIVEVNHLPPFNSNAFKQMQELFRIILDYDQIIYTWGTVEKLKAFTRFDLFTIEQIYQSDHKNLQRLFEDYWRRCHIHKRDKNCECEKCLGRKPGQTWKLLDAVAYQLHEWLDKRHTRSKFDIGLDTRLERLGPDQLKYRITLTDYAVNDVLSMEKLMISMQERPPPPGDKTSTEQTDDMIAIQNQNPLDPTHELSVMLCIHSSSFLINSKNQQTANHEAESSNQINLRSEEKELDQHNKQVQIDLNSLEQNPKRQRHESQEESDELKSTDRYQQLEYRNQVDSSEQQEQTDPQHRSQRTIYLREPEQTDPQHRSQRTVYLREPEPTDPQHRSRRTICPRQPEQTDQRRQHTRIDEQDKHERTDQMPDHHRKRRRSNPDIEPERPFDNHHSRRQHNLDQERRKMKIATTDIERKKCRNRISTLKQRERKYKHVIIRRGIDSRFSISIVREILRRYGIPYTAINISKSGITGRKSLYFGIDDRSKFRECEIRTKELFTTEFYNEFSARHHL